MFIVHFNFLNEVVFKEEKKQKRRSFVKERRLQSYNFASDPV